MLRPDSPSRRDIVTDFAIALIADEGVGALTVRALARRIRVTPAGLQHWSGPRREMLVLITATFGQRWQQWMWRRQFRDGALALLPTTSDEVVWTRVWLGLQDLGRTESAVGEVISANRAHERELIAHSVPDLTTTTTWWPPSRWSTVCALPSASATSRWIPWPLATCCADRLAGSPAA